MFHEYKKDLIINLSKNYEVVPVTFVGILMRWNHFSKWVDYKAKYLGINTEKSISFDETFDAIKSKLNIKEDDVYWLTGKELIYCEDDCVIVGNIIEHMDERLSLKRMKIDIREKLEKIGLIDTNKPTECIQIHSDILVSDKVKE